MKHKDEGPRGLANAAQILVALFRAKERNKMTKNLFFLDAETDGLHGPFLSVAAIVTDALGRDIDAFSCSMPVGPDDVSTRWLATNVVPYLANAEIHVESEAEILARFWDFWMLHREDSVCVADVPFPVEARLFSRCIALAPQEREFLGPYPLLDLATALHAVGIDPLTPRLELTDLKLAQHDAINDVLIEKDIWFSCLPNDAEAAAFL